LTPVQLRNRLRQWRLDNGLSLTELADLTGLSPSMLNRVERGEREMAPLTRVHVARRLGVSVGELFDVPPIGEAD
jgi:transcriptional regulator with XRE-family HTH domain